jgi:NAD(P)-dependent dehydrogenase (short-subunit alcohol dehydrogenase family)
VLLICHGTVCEKGITDRIYGDHNSYCTIPEYDEFMNINVRSTMHLVSMTVPFMKQAGGGTISIMTSTQGTSPDPRSPVSSMANGMLHMLVKCNALEGAFHGIRVNAVASGVIASKARTKEHITN